MGQTTYREPAQPRPLKKPPVAGLSAIRASHGLTQAAVCERVAAILDKSFTVGALSAIEKGHRGASAEVLTALESALRLPAGALNVDYDPGHLRRRQIDEVA